MKYQAKPEIEIGPDVTATGEWRLVLFHSGFSPRSKLAAALIGFGDKGSIMAILF